jgi:hypothetical protein
MITRLQSRKIVLFIENKSISICGWACFNFDREIEDLMEAERKHSLSGLFTKTRDSPPSVQFGLVKLAEEAVDRMREHLKAVLGFDPS